MSYSDLPDASSNPADLPDRFDVLIIGGGAAGLYTALCLPPHLQVGLITKDQLSLSASDWAQGGIAAAIAADDSPELHLQDTLKAGAGLCERSAVALLVEKAADCVRKLVEMGVAFDRDRQAQLALTLEAAHSRRRVLHAADTTGRAMVTTLMAQVLDRANIQVLQAFVLDLVLDQAQPGSDAQPRCQGAILVQGDRLLRVAAGAVILATGGGGQVYAQTTNPALSTGDGVAMAWRSGAELRDLEFVQFHPTALTQPGAPRFLISEAVRGEGAHLVDETGRRFAFDYHPAGELAPRDVVSRAIFNHLQQTSPDPAAAHVWLDLRSIDPATVQHRFPNIIQVCKQWGIDLFQQPIPVAPAAHYWMGGITTDSHSGTTIPGLYAVGETASTGVHGANRLASNSLLECLVFGAQLAAIEVAPVEPMFAEKSAEKSAERSAERSVEESAEESNEESNELAAFNWSLSLSPQLEAIRQALPRLMWQSAGICREQTSLSAAIAEVEQWRQIFAADPLSQTVLQAMAQLRSDHPIPLPQPEMALTLRQWSELRNLLDIAGLMLKSAAFRTESRGGHYRSDYPQPDPQWQVHTVVVGDSITRSPLIDH